MTDPAALLAKSDIEAAIEKLRANVVPPIKPNADKVHPTCCNGWRKAGNHSAYCFTQREFYVMYCHGVKLESL